ncbi:MAG: squalene/phytoene synthase family protein [Ramlibacter sp.]|nr:squalene/phytoene synthase family protein [Ramlibacter sp.]
MPALLRGVSRSFYLSIRLLPAPLRHPIGVAYLLARATDTVADTAGLPADVRRDLLETLTTAIEGRTPAHAALARLAAVFAQEQGGADERRLILALPQCLEQLEALAPADRGDVRAVLRHITYGQALDIERFAPGGAPRALQTAEQLDEYTYLVAGCVGEFWTDLCVRHLPGFATLPPREMRELGRAYGMGLQLVNILRDAGADLAAGRCYFPATELAAAGLQFQDVVRHPERFAAVRDPWLGRAQRGLDAGMRYADAVKSRRVRVASALPALLGARTLALLRADPALGLARKVKVPRGEVHGMMARLAFTLAGRASLARLYAKAAGSN